VRQKATEALEKLGEGALKPLRQALEGKPSVELRRRVEQLLAKLDLSITSGEGLRVARAIEVLERIGTAEARQVLRDLAEGGAASWRGQEAKASLARLPR
jgi:HEAT repeat protein